MEIIKELSEGIYETYKEHRKKLHKELNEEYFIQEFLIEEKYKALEKEKKEKEYEFMGTEGTQYRNAVRMLSLLNIKGMDTQIDYEGKRTGIW